MGNWDSYRDDLDALKTESDNLIQTRNDVMKKIAEEGEEEQQPMKPTNEVQLWLSRVQAVETEVSELIRGASEELEKLHPAGGMNISMSSSSYYELEDMVADKLEAVTNLIKEGAFLVADEVPVVTTLIDEGAPEVAVAETIPAEDVADDQWPIVGMESIINEVWRCLKKEDEEGGGGGDDDDYGYEEEEEEEEDDDVGIIGFNYQDHRGISFLAATEGGYRRFGSGRGETKQKSEIGIGAGLVSHDVSTSISNSSGFPTQIQTADILMEAVGSVVGSLPIVSGSDQPELGSMSAVSGTEQPFEEVVTLMTNGTGERVINAEQTVEDMCNTSNLGECISASGSYPLGPEALIQMIGPDPPAHFNKGFSCVPFGPPTGLVEGEPDVKFSPFSQVVVAENSGQNSDPLGSHVEVGKIGGKKYKSLKQNKDRGIPKSSVWQRGKRKNLEEASDINRRFAKFRKVDASGVASEESREFVVSSGVTNEVGLPEELDASEAIVLAGLSSTARWVQ
ncbi:hypothetical protein LWI29_013267 [Acer saccharum]|uniref:Uncharacterized protein n=1 Tax=Acer saccharum TaxID=4024 RepID=A0AA39SKU2_ACESA|nr:hypothetical protein LWI29_013267 [Acer saccharum]